MCAITLGVDLDAVSEAQDPLTGAGARRGPALDRGGEQLRHERIVFDKPVRFVSKSTPFDEVGDTANRAVQDTVQVHFGWGRGGVKVYLPIILRRPVGAIKDQRVEMDIQIECPAESLDEGDRTTMGRTVPGSRRATSVSTRGEDGAHEYAQDLSRQLSIMGQAVTQTERQGEHLLAHRNSRQHPVHEMRRRVGHVATAARRAETPSFARIGDQPIQPATVAVDAKETVRKDSAIEKSS